MEVSSVGFASNGRWFVASAEGKTINGTVYPFYGN